MALWELSANSWRVPDAAMTIVETKPWEACSSRKSTAKFAGSQFSDVTNDQILSQLSKTDKRKRNGNGSEIGDSRASNST